MGRENQFKTKVIRSFTWFTTGTFVGQFISWISTLAVIRLLAPSDYGLMAMTLPFLGFMQMVSELGIGSAIVQSQKVDENEIRRIFGLMVITNGVIWVLSYGAAPYVALFFHEQKLTMLIRLLSVNFLLISFFIIPQSLYTREMDFRTKAGIDIATRIVTALLTLALALKHMGIWALVVGEITQYATKAVWYNVIRRPWLKPVFRLKGSNKMFRYGITVTGDKLLYYLCTQSDKIIAGRFLGKEALGIYAIAFNLASLPIDRILPIITQFSFTAYSRIQDDLGRIQVNLLRTIRVVSFVAFPLFLGLAGVATEVISFLLGPKWRLIIDPFRLFCLILPFISLSTILPPAVFAIGKPVINLVNMAITSVFMSISFLIGVKFGITGLCFAWLAAFPVIFLITTTRCLHALGLQLRHLLAAIKFPVFTSLLMLTFLLLLKKMLMVLGQPLLLLTIYVSFSAAFYSALLFIFKRDEVLKLKNLLQQ